MRARTLTTLVAAAAVAVGVTSGSVNATEHVQPVAVIAAHPAPGLDNSGIGSLADAGSSDHSCTAALLDSPGHNLIVTDAHCIHGNGAGMRFVPDDTNGSQPYGSWTTTSAYVPAGWAHGDTDSDIAVLTLAPHGPTNLGNIISGYTPGTTHAGQHVQVRGYPSGHDNTAVTCHTTVGTDQGHPYITCPGMSTGTSGSPWLTWDGNEYAITGLIGGYRQGGCQIDTSYSPTIAGNLTDLVDQASMRTRPDTVTDPPSSGC